MCLRQAKMLCHFSHFLSCVHGVFNSPVATPAYGLRPCFRLRITSANASLLALYVCSTTHPHFTKLLTRALFFEPCHCSYIFAPCLTFRVHVTGDLNKPISFVVNVLTTSFAHALLRLIH